ncbi:hypothetical protein ACI782_24680 [Geodermatophilus sp. SYSU D00703]
MTEARPVPRRWVLALAGAAVALFAAGFVVRLECRIGGGCGRWSWLLDLDAVGGLPRLFTTVLLAAASWAALRAACAASGGPARWWTAVGALGLVLAAAKLVSIHGTLKAGVPPLVQFLVGVVLAVPVLAALWGAGRRAGVAATGAVVLALAGYAAAALSLDVLTDLAALVQHRIGLLTRAAGTLVEELGEALAALALLVVVRGQSSRQQ